MTDNGRKGPMQIPSFNPANAVPIAQKICRWNYLQRPIFNTAGQMVGIELVSATCPKANMNLGKGGCDYWNTAKEECNIVLAMANIANMDISKLKT